jgi:flagellar export protein FliJ
MRKRRTLESLQKLAEYAADAASRDVVERLRSLRNEESRLDQLRSFVGDYEQLLREGRGINVARLRGRRDFVDRLNGAIGRQGDVVRDQERQYNDNVDRWRGARTRSLALQRYAQRLADIESERRERREQSMLDEVGQQTRLKHGRSQ